MTSVAAPSNTNDEDNFTTQAALSLTRYGGTTLFRRFQFFFATCTQVYTHDVNVFLIQIVNDRQKYWIYYGS
jgi:hypothetical protein